MHAKAGDVRQVDDLGMLDPPAPVADKAARHIVYRAQQLGVGGIADGVHRHLKPVHARPHHTVAQFRRGQHRQAAIGRCIGIGCLQPRPA